MSNRAWMPLHITDYLADTGHLNAAEHGAYLMLIMHYWQNGSLPTDERLLARLARMTKTEWDEGRDVLAMLFGPEWTHKRIDAELAKADDIIEKRRNAALERHSRSKRNASAVHVDSTSSDTGALPRTLNPVVKEEANASSKKRGCRLPDDFDPDLDWAVSAGLTPSQAKSQFEKFRDYWAGQSGAKGVKADWPATWRNWVRSALERMPHSRGSPARQPNLADAFAATSTILENGNDPRYDTGNEGTRSAIPYLSRVSG